MLHGSRPSATATAAVVVVVTRCHAVGRGRAGDVGGRSGPGGTPHRGDPSVRRGALEARTAQRARPRHPPARAPPRRRRRSIAITIVAVAAGVDPSAPAAAEGGERVTRDALPLRAGATAGGPWRRPRPGRGRHHWGIKPDKPGKSLHQRPQNPPRHPTPRARLPDRTNPPRRAARRLRARPPPPPAVAPADVDLFAVDPGRDNQPWARTRKNSTVRRSPSSSDTSGRHPRTSAARSIAITLRRCSPAFPGPCCAGCGLPVRTRRCA